MRDGVEPPNRRVLRPDHREEDHATRNLAGKRKGRKSVRSRADARERRKNSGKYRVSDSGEEGE